MPDNEEHVMPEDSRPPAEGIRAISHAAAVEQTPSGAPRISGHFARFNVYNEIDSAIEGRFLERIAPGAFNRTFKNNGPRIRMLFQHGRDPIIGDKPIGVPDTLREDDIGPYFEGDIFASVPPLVVDGLRAGQYGISYRFAVVNEDWDQAPKRSDYNPSGLPERTIREAKVFEFGPVTFPADPGADYAVRSITLTDLDAALAPHEEPALPDGPAAEPHSDEGTREAEAPAVPEPKETPTVEYLTPDEKRARDREITDELTKVANDYTGLLPSDVQERWDSLTSEQDRLRAELAAHEARMERLAAAAPDERKVEPPYTAPMIVRRPLVADIYDIAAIERGSTSLDDRAQKYRDNAMRAAEQMTPAHPMADRDAVRGNIAHLLDHKDSEEKELARRILVTGSPQYRREFERYIRSNGELRGTALAVGVDGTGGYAVPFQLDPTIVHTGAWTSVNPYRASCRVETIVGTDTWQAITANAITAAYALEAAAADEQGPTFTQPAYVVKRAHAAVTASYEVLSDRSDLASELAVLIGEAKDTLEEAQFTTGAGTTVYPQGIGLKDAFTRVDSVTNDTTAVADVLAVEAALPIRHRMNAAWYLTRKAIRAIQAWETTGGQLFSGVGYPAVGNPVARSTGNTGLTLLGYPIWETPSMPWTPTTDDTTWGVLMDPRNYVVVDRAGLSVKVIPDAFDATTGFPTGQSFIYAFWRNTARVLNVDGGRQGAVQ